jgi:hypothetical protein
MAHQKAAPTPLDVTVAYAADAYGAGLAYALVHGSQRDRALRVPFEARVVPGLGGREIGYAALLAIASELRGRGLNAVSFRVGDAALVRDIRERRDLPTVLTVPYVSVRCALNRFARAEVAFTDDERWRDLDARARADASLHLAA